MNYSLSHLYKLKKIYTRDHKWFTKEQLKAFKQKRKIREAKEAEKAVKEEQRRAETQKKEEQKKTKEKEKNRKAQVDALLKKYRLAKKAAREEQNLEEQSGDLSYNATAKRQELLQVLMKLHEMDFEVPQRDIRFEVSFLAMYPEFVNSKTIRFFIDYATKTGGIDQTEKMVLILKDILEDTKYYDPLWQYLVWVRKMKNIPKMIEMKEKGMSNYDIAEITGISSAEISILLNDSDKIPILPDDLE